MSTDLMLKAMPAFEAVRSYSNGPAWLGLIEFAARSEPTLRIDDSDDESDAAMVYTRERAGVEGIKERLVNLAADPETLQRTILEARAKGFGHGDL
ncbi:MAG: hypothetical protein IT373_36810 [Polyangiaceae bacterium]|nr:hypothetical protein [Polyangiaceae bacterium]